MNVTTVGSRRFAQGQSLTELALFLPILLLLVLIALDFGRVYLGWINLQQMARLAANYAADHASAWYGNPSDPFVVRYRQIVLNEAQLTNCTLVDDVVPDPVFEEPTNPRPPGSDVRVDLECQFELITPIIAQIVGNPVTASASATFPVKEGIVVTGDSGGGSATQPPTAGFVGSPASGWGPLQVTFTDLSTGSPGSWSWSFSVSVGGSGSGSASPSTSSSSGSVNVTYSCAGDPGDTCTFGVSLTVQNSAGADTVTRNNYITVTVPPDSGPIFDFTASPTSGEEPLAVNFQYVDLGGTPAASWAWDFDGNGTVDSTAQNPSHTYATDGVYTVVLTASDGTDSNTLTKANFIVVDNKVCTVPDFARVRVFSAPQIWADAGFTGTLTALSGQGNYLIQFQSLVGGLVDPQPDGCASNITVGP